MAEVQGLSDLPETISNLLPQDEMSVDILKHTRESLAQPIFNHSVRVFLLAKQLCEKESVSKTDFISTSAIPVTPAINQKLLFAACLFHDIGVCPSHNGPQRFDVEGADAAVTYLRSHGVEGHPELHAVWCAIALHNSAGIAERIDPFTRLVRVGVKADFSPSFCDSIGLTAYSKEIEKHLPRLGIEQCLAKAVVYQATRGEKDLGLYTKDEPMEWTDSQKFPRATWPGIILRGHLEMVQKYGEDWQGLNPAF